MMVATVHAPLGDELVGVGAGDHAIINQGGEHLAQRQAVFIDGFCGKLQGIPLL